MTRTRLAIMGVAALAVCVVAYAFLTSGSKTLVLTGIVTTNEVIVSPQVTGQIERLSVREGDSVKRDSCSR